MELTQSVIEMYEKTRTKMLREQLQKTTSVVAPYAQVVHGCNGKMYEFPFVGMTELNYRDSRMQEIDATELEFGKRFMKPNLFEKFLKFSTDDEKFLAGLPVNSTTMVTQLAHAAARAKDPLLLGTCLCVDNSSPVKGQYIIMPSGGGVFLDPTDGSPYKAGSTGGLLGDNYVGDMGTEKAVLPMQPYLMSGGLTTTYLTQYTGEASTALDFKRTNVIPCNWSEDGTATNTGLTVEKILAVIQAFEERYGFSGGRKLCMAITPRQKRELIQDERMQNKDFGFQALKTGCVNELLGIHFLVTDAVPMVNVGTAGAPQWVRACPVWRPEELLYGVWEDAKFYLRKPDTYIDKMLVGVTLGLGACRTREETVLTVHCWEGNIS